jgi:ubiquinone/menaquinone biosynthesis C-methylase UbiE
MKEHIYRNPKKYSENNSLQYNFAMDMLSNIVFGFSSRVLDIGCGDGAITSEIAKIVHEGCVIGTDISTQMTEHASSTISI